MGRRRAPRPNVLDDPRLAAAVPTVLAATIFAAEFLRIRAWWFIPGRSTYGYPQGVAQRVLDGTARAPDQYRILAPRLAQALASVLGVPLPTALVLLDLAATATTVALLHVLAARLDERPLVVVAALVWAWWSSRLDHWDPHVTLLTVVVTAAALLLVTCRLDVRVAGALLALGVVTLGLRTDYAAGLGLVVLVVGARRRSGLVALVGALVLVAAPLATVALTRAYPQARYESAVVQLDYNLTVGSLAAVATFYLPVLAVPVAYLVRRRVLPPLWFVPLWFLGELAATFVVGRPDESRIFLPLAPALAVAAAVAFLELRHPAISAATAAAPAPTRPERVSVS